ncbi:MAG: ATP-binding protein [Rhodovibrionaceae bacterium]
MTTTSDLSGETPAPQRRGGGLAPASQSVWWRRWLKKIQPRSLMARSLITLVLPLLLLQMLTTFLFYERHYIHVSSRLAESVAGDIAAVIQLLESTPRSWERERVFALGEKEFQINLSYLEDAILPPKSVTEPTLLGRRLREALSLWIEKDFDLHMDDDDNWAYISIAMNDGLLLVEVPRRRLFSRTTHLLLNYMVGAPILFLVISLIVMRYQVRPIRRLARAAKRFGMGHDVRNFKPEGAKEVRQAGRVFVEMHNRIKRQLKQRTAMLAGVSHDLRTPLTRMKLELELLEGGPEVEALKSEIAEMEQMIEAYLAFARGEGAEDTEEIVIGDLLQEIVAKARRDGSEIALSVEEDIALTVRPNSVRRCLSNLINNAVRYGGRVAVSARPSMKGVEILIDDDGSGIPADKREEVFRPFYRLEESRNLETGGTGLGLTIARDIARSHGGELTLEDGPGGRGLRARVWLPILAEPTDLEAWLGTD